MLSQRLQMLMRRYGEVYSVLKGSIRASQVQAAVSIGMHAWDVDPVAVTELADSVLESTARTECGARILPANAAFDGQEVATHQLSAYVGNVRVPLMPEEAALAQDALFKQGVELTGDPQMALLDFVLTQGTDSGVNTITFKWNTRLLGTAVRPANTEPSPNCYVWTYSYLDQRLSG